MDKRRMLIGLIVLLAIPLYIWIAYVEIPAKSKIGEEKLQQDPLQHDFSQVLKYDNPYMGNASNVGNLFQALPLNEYKGTFAMDPDQLSLVINYNVNASELEGKAEDAFLYNSTAAFLLIHNLDKLEMRFLDKSFVTTRNRVENWFGSEWESLKDPEEFKKQVQQKLKDGEQEDWLQSYKEGDS